LISYYHIQLRTKACRAGWHLPALPHASVTSHGARGASKQLPYPPGWWRDNTTVGKNIKTTLLKKGESGILTKIDVIILTEYERIFCKA